LLCLGGTSTRFCLAFADLKDADGTAKAVALAISKGIGATKGGAISSSCREETLIDLFAEQALWPHIIVAFREAFSVLSAAGCSDEALVHELYLSGEPAEIFEAAAEEGFFRQLKHHSSVSQYGQLKGALLLDGTDVRARFQTVLKTRVESGAFMREFQAIEKELEVPGESNPLEQLYAQSAKSELGVAEDKVFKRLGLGVKTNGAVNGTH
jgi:ketol-acid reductoisomerase